MNFMECDVCSQPVLDKQLVTSYSLSNVLLPRNPIVFGHLIVTPSRHVENYSQITDDEAVDLKNTIKSLDEYFRKEFGSVGYNMISNVGAKAGQTVFHCHIHIFMRYEDEKYSPLDVLNGKVVGDKLTPDQWSEMKNKIASVLKNL